MENKFYSDQCYLTMHKSLERLEQTDFLYIKALSSPKFFCIV